MHTTLGHFHLGHQAAQSARGAKSCLGSDIYMYIYIYIYIYLYIYISVKTGLIFALKVYKGQMKALELEIVLFI